MAGDLAARAKGEADSARVLKSGSRIIRVLVVIEIGILLGVLILFNLFPEKVGIYSSAVRPYVFVPLLTPEWLSYMPWLNTWWMLALVLAAVKLAHGRWTQPLRWADLGVHLLGILVVTSALWGVPVAVVNAGGAGAGFPALSSANQHTELRWMFDASLRLVLAALIIGFFTKLAKLGVRLPVLRLR